MIFTIGHSNHPIEKFIDILKINNIDAVIDVRSNPISAYSPQFNRMELMKNLKMNDIKYFFMGNTLGGRPEDTSVLNSLNKIELEIIETKSWYNDAISKLIEFSKKNNIAVMCSEEDPQKCHRGYIISHTLLGKNQSVIHIRGNSLQQKAKFFERQGLLF